MVLNFGNVPADIVALERCYKLVPPLSGARFHSFVSESEMFSVYVNIIEVLI